MNLFKQFCPYFMPNQYPVVLKSIPGLHLFFVKIAHVIYLRFRKNWETICWQPIYICRM